MPKLPQQKQKKKLESLQKETKAAKTIALTVQDIEAMGKESHIRKQYHADTG